MLAVGRTVGGLAQKARSVEPVCTKNPTKTSEFGCGLLQVVMSIDTTSSRPCASNAALLVHANDGTRCLPLLSVLTPFSCGPCTQDAYFSRFLHL